MELTKHAHACITVTQGSNHLVVDPGTLTPDAAALVAGTDTVLITHEHFDHFDETLIAESLDARPELTVYGPSAVVDRWDARPGQVVAVRDGDHFTVAGIEVSVHGEVHAEIHPDIPRVTNVGYLFEASVFHPGDAYHVPPAAVGTLLLPTSGPWTKFGMAIDYVRAVGPARVVQIHELMLSDLGQQSLARFLSPTMLSAVPLEIVPAGETISV